MDWKCFLSRCANGLWRTNILQSLFSFALMSVIALMSIWVLFELSEAIFGEGLEFMIPIILIGLCGVALIFAIAYYAIRAIAKHAKDCRL